MTTYEYDDDGRLCRSVTVRDSEWTEQDRAEVLALALHRQSLCPCGCGFLSEDTLSHEQGGPRFVVSKTLCRARRELIDNQTAFAKSKGKAGDPIAGARLWRIAKE